MYSDKIKYNGLYTKLERTYSIPPIFDYVSYIENRMRNYFDEYIKNIISTLSPQHNIIVLFGPGLLNPFDHRFWLMFSFYFPEHPRTDVEGISPEVDISITAQPDKLRSTLHIYVDINSWIYNSTIDSLDPYDIRSTIYRVDLHSSTVEKEIDTALVGVQSFLEEQRQSIIELIQSRDVFR